MMALTMDVEVTTLTAGKCMELRSEAALLHNKETGTSTDIAYP